MAWVFGAFVWLEITSSGLLAIARSGLNLETIERASDWEETHGIPFMPMIALIAVGFWIAADAGLLLARKFTDGAGKKITHWI